MMKIGLISLGCPKNLVDSEVMLGLAHDAGHELTQRRGSRRRARRQHLRLHRFGEAGIDRRDSRDGASTRSDGACPRLIVTGCLAERYRDELRAEIPEIDAVLGTGEVPEIVRAIGGIGGAGVAPLTFYSDVASSRRSLQPPACRPHACRPTSTTPKRRGCWPRRGTTPTSRSPKAATTSARSASSRRCAGAIAAGRPIRSSGRRGALAARGVKELLLISQDTTFYGIDRHERGALARLLRELNAVDGLEWIRLLYLYPTTIDDETLAAMAECEKVCKYIDLPLQHASNPVLKRMKRPGTRQNYDRLLTRIRARVPGVALRTTFIVGFPGETDADVAELCGFVTDHGFDHVGVFTYSHEEGTSAHALARRRAGPDQSGAAQTGS